MLGAKVRSLSWIFVPRFRGVGRGSPLNSHYFLIFMNFSFYICLVPCRITLSSRGSYSLKSNTPQKILCGGLTLLLCLQGALLIRGAYTAKLVNKPEVLFTMWSMSHCGLFTLTWAYTFWFRQSKFLEMCNFMPSAPSTHKSKGVTLLLMGTVFAYYVAYVLFVVIGGRGGDLSRGFTRFSLRTLYELFVVGQRNESLLVLSVHNNASYVGDIMGGVGGFWIPLGYASLRVYGQIIIGLTCALISLSALIMNEAIQKLSQLAQRDGAQKRDELYEGYMGLRAFISLINEVVRPFVLFLCSANVVFFARRLTATLDNGGWSFRGMLLLNLLSHLIPFVLAANAHHNGRILKDRLLRLNRWSGSKYSSRIFQDEFGLQGMRFFTVSYGFIGSVGSACLSYIILLLQMQPPPTCDQGEDDF